MERLRKEYTLELQEAVKASIDSSQNTDNLLKIIRDLETQTTQMTQLQSNMKSDYSRELFEREAAVKNKQKEADEIRTLLVSQQREMGDEKQRVRFNIAVNKIT